MARRPSTWVNFQDYLGLNQEVGQEMGQRLVDDVGQQAAKAGGKLTSAQREYGVRVEGGTLAGPDANAFNSSSNLYSPEQIQQNAAGGYGGPHSLGDLDPSLYGDVKDAVGRVKAAQDPSTMGSELATAYGGQAGSGGGGRALDAFLTGQTSAAALSGLDDSYGGMMESLGIAEKEAVGQAQKAEEKSAAAAGRWAELAAGDGKGSAEDNAQWTPPGFKDYRSFMDSGSAGQYAHEAAMYASPADWATRGLGELGYDGENVSQLFSKFFGANGNESGGTGDWNTGNLRSAARLVQDQYGDKAVEAWFKGLDQKSWQDLMNKGNAGAQARRMRAWLQENGYQRIR